MGRKSIDTKIRVQNKEKRNAWADELFPYFQTHGIKRITMDDVAAHLDKSKATIYKYFKTKDEIVDLLMSRHLEGIQQFEHILTDKNLAFLDRYTGSIDLLSGYLSKISELFLSDLKQYYPATWQRISGFITYTEHLLEQYYIEGIEQGALQALSPKLLVLSDRLFFNALSNPDFLIESGLSIQEAFEQYFQLKLYGMVKG